MANSACYQAIVTTDAQGNITNIVPVNTTSKNTILKTTTNNQTPAKKTSTGLIAAKTGGLLSNPILIVGLAAVALLFMGGSHANH